MSQQAQERGARILHLMQGGYFEGATHDLSAAVAVWKMWAASCRLNDNEHNLAMRERARNEVTRCMA